LLKIGCTNKKRLKLLIDKVTEISLETFKEQDELKKLKEEIYSPSKAILIVHKTIYPGSVIMINKIKKIVDKEIINKRFLISAENEIISV